MAPTPPVFVVVPGASQSPSHYAALLHALHQQGHPTLCALLPTTGTTDTATVHDDMLYVRDRLLLPVLDVEGRDIVLVTHSYSALPGGAAAAGLSPAERAAAGKATAVVGQIYIAAVLARGADGKDLLSSFGGQLPPHIRADEPMNVLRCDDPKPPLFQDVPEPLATAAVQACLCPSLTSFTSPIPPATWDAPAYKGRCAFVRTLHDQAIPLAVQDMMIEGTGQEWIRRDIETGHSPQLAAPEKLTALLIELAREFEAMGRG